MTEKCCSSSADIKKMVKESYGKRWAEEERCCDEPEDTLSTVHDALMSELSPAECMKVLDVGSGTGDTVLAIAREVGPKGKAVGIDFTKEGIAKARKKAQDSGLDGIAEFRLADAEKLPFEDETFDAVISECVVCLTADKQKVLAEKVRVLKPGGRVIMHDVISWAPMPESIRKDPGLYCGCIGGAVSMKDYRYMMEKAGLVDIKAVDHSDQIRKRLSAGILSAALELRENDKAFDEIAGFLRKGGIGYALFVGTKPKN